MDWTIGLMVINKDSYYDGAYFKVSIPKPRLRPPSTTPASLRSEERRVGKECPV